MLEIRMASGDVLIHDDQQPDAMTIKGYDGSQVLVHAGEWGRHKYIRKEGNRYIYPEDLQKAAQRGYEVVKKGQKIANTANDFIKTKAEIAKYATKDALRKGSEATSKTAETVSQKAKNIYDDRKIYADAAKNMTYDVVKGSKIGKLYKTAQDVVGDVKSEAAVDRSQVTAGHKKKSSISFKKPISQVTKPLKKSDSGVITPTNPNLGNNSSSRFVGKGATLYAIKNIADNVKEKNRKKKAEQEAIANASHMTESEKKKRANTLAFEIKNDPLYTAIQDKKRKKIEEDRPKSRKKKVVTGGKEIKKGDSIKERAAEKERQEQHEANIELQRKKTAERKEAKRQAQMREEQQIRDAHRTDTSRPSGSNTSANLEKQKRKTAARRQAKYISDTSNQVSYNHQGYSNGAGNSSTSKLEEMKAKKRAKDIKKYGYSEYTRRRAKQNAYK